MHKKSIIISIILLAILIGGWYGYSEYNRKVKNLSSVTADFNLSGNQLLSEFEANEPSANQKYLGKIVAVSEVLRSVEVNDNGNYFLILGPENSMSSIRCSMDSTMHEEVKSLVNASVVRIKGVCTGFNSDELLGSDIILNRCVIELN